MASPGLGCARDVLDRHPSAGVVSRGARTTLVAGGVAIVSWVLAAVAGHQYVDAAGRHLLFVVGGANATWWCWLLVLVAVVATLLGLVAALGLLRRRWREGWGAVAGAAAVIAVTALGFLLVPLALVALLGMTHGGGWPPVVAPDGAAVRVDGGEDLLGEPFEAVYEQTGRFVWREVMVDPAEGHLDLTQGTDDCTLSLPDAGRRTLACGTTRVSV